MDGDPERTGRGVVQLDGGDGAPPAAGLAEATTLAAAEVTVVPLEPSTEPIRVDSEIVERFDEAPAGIPIEAIAASFAPATPAGGASSATPSGDAYAGRREESQACWAAQRSLLAKFEGA